VVIVPEAWGRLLRNLIDNALVQPTARKTVRLEVRRVEGCVETDVIDFGPGVSEGNRDKIFRRFFTVRPEGVSPGTGLGLSIVEAVAAAHQGTVQLLPADPSRGAAFRVSLPVSAQG
jgi:K+-sensing histidine kinase KdpD